jgi:hypothetical protein
MKKSNKVVYIVEGECEKTFINAVKNEHIISGMPYVFNPLQQSLTTRIRTYPQNTCVILIFDTDRTNPERIEKLKDNIRSLEKSSNIHEIILIPQVNNFEDEIKYATDIKQMKDFTNSKTNSEFKEDFIKQEKHILKKLKRNNFDIQKLWSRKPANEYSQFENGGYKIKLKLSQL